MLHYKYHPKSQLLECSFRRFQQPTLHHFSQYCLQTIRRTLLEYSLGGNIMYILFYMILSSISITPQVFFTRGCVTHLPINFHRFIRGLILIGSNSISNYNNIMFQLCGELRTLSRMLACAGPCHAAHIATKSSIIEGCTGIGWALYPPLTTS